MSYTARTDWPLLHYLFGWRLNENTTEPLIILFPLGIYQDLLYGTVPDDRGRIEI